MTTTIEDLVAASEEAYQQRDAHTTAALFHPNANVPTLTGDFGVGRAAIEKHFEAVLPAMPDDIEHHVTAKNVHYVTPDLALIDTVGENYRETATGGREKLSVEGFTMIAVREHGEWLWAGIRGALVPEAHRHYAERI